MSQFESILDLCKATPSVKPRFRMLKRGKQWLLFLVGNPLNYALIKNKITFFWINA